MWFVKLNSGGGYRYVAREVGMYVSGKCGYPLSPTPQKWIQPHYFMGTWGYGGSGMVPDTPPQGALGVTPPPPKIRTTP